MMSAGGECRSDCCRAHSSCYRAVHSFYEGFKTARCELPAIATHVDARDGPEGKGNSPGILCTAYLDGAAFARYGWVAWVAWGGVSWLVRVGLPNVQRC